MIRNAKVGDRVLVLDRTGKITQGPPIAYWDFSKGITGTVVERWEHTQRIYLDVEADPPNYGVFTFSAGELKRIVQNPPPHSCYLCGKELINLNYNPYCPNCQMYSLPACPVCGKGYIHKVDPDHYYHIRETLFGNIPHYPPSGLCVDRKE